MHLESHESADDRQYYDYNMDRNGHSLHDDEQDLTPTKMKESTAIKFLQDKEQSDYRLNESGEQLSDLLDEYAESHTQAHTEGLREENERLQSQLFRYRTALEDVDIELSHEGYANSSGEGVDKARTIIKEALKNNEG